LTHRLQILEADNEKMDGQLGELKRGNLDGESSKQSAEGLTRKVQILEDELDQSEKNLKEAVEKCVDPSIVSCIPLIVIRLG
jgi:tropomyosin